MTNDVYLGVAKNDGATFVDIEAADRGREPTPHALDLADHHSCERVQVWRDDERVAVVARSAEGRAP